MDLLANASANHKDIKEEICFEEEPLEYSHVDALSNIASEYSALQLLNLKCEKKIPVSKPVL